MEYPYQVVTFFDMQPREGEPVYHGESGWFPQVAFKRRFGLVCITEQELIDKLRVFSNATEWFDIEFQEPAHPVHMPVEVIPVVGPKVHTFHRNLVAFLGSNIVSKYPEREGANYFPHMTIEWSKERVVEPRDFENSARKVERFWLVKDTDDGEDSIAFQSFELRGDK